MRTKFSSPFLLYRIITLLAAMAISAFAAETGVAVIRKADSLPATIPWNLEQLSEVPECERGEGKEVLPLHYRGEPFQGKPTRVFAYYATPGSLSGDPAMDKKLPGMVLVHGGGGRAFEGWVKLWASRGYAAIAMDLSGRGIGGKPLPDGGPDQHDDVKFVDGPTTDQWSYHAVANVIRAHSLLLSMPEVDPERTALTGISWGGYLTCIVAGLDDRFKAAVPVYGCGFLHENSCWLKRFESMEHESRARWIRLWDPSNYVGSARMPMLFVNGGTDFAYPPDSHAKSYALVKSPKNLHYVPSLRHGHVFDKPKAVEVFIDSILKQGAPLPRIEHALATGQGITAEVAGATSLVNAQIHHTTDALSDKPADRKWISQPANLSERKVQAPLPPANATIWFLTVEDERGVTVSTELVFPTAISK